MRTAILRNRGGKSARRKFADHLVDVRVRGISRLLLLEQLDERGPNLEKNAAQSVVSTFLFPSLILLNYIFSSFSPYVFHFVHFLFFFFFLSSLHLFHSLFIDRKDRELFNLKVNHEWRNESSSRCQRRATFV